ncbi:SDR family NAD(P)-dependent oxidoreductase [Acidisphaera sp. L21]|uniref:SDR family NAD(P)-dependent oxidoreductase n=1 Tax=Acidisphaera sp. L21 TaxID=1641851 RepID=UPI00131B4750|nr:SDR family oxidoreductase [Acidisphaera sp. L21]
MQRTAFISGSGRNIGRAIALKLARVGVNIVVNGRANQAACEAVATDVRALGVEALVLMGDVGLLPEARRLGIAALDRFGTIDILVNNAGSRPHQPLLSISDADWTSVLDTNLGACFWLSRAFLPGMIERRWGRIINFSGMNSIRGATGYAHIAAAKHGGWGLAKSIATEFGPYGITANSISPGPIRQDGQESADTAEQAERLRVPLGRTGLPADVAAAVALLCSEEGGFISGQMIAVNGGAQT